MIAQSSRLRVFSKLGLTVRHASTQKMAVESKEKLIITLKYSDPLFQEMTSLRERYVYLLYFVQTAN